MDGRISALDGLRGYAALAVLFYHAILGYNYAGLTAILTTPIQDVPTGLLLSKFFLTILSGQSAVAIFFLLSGCVLTRSAAKDVEKSDAIRASLAFAIRRTLRVFPAVITCVLACAAAMATQNWVFDISPTGTFDAERLVRNALLLNYDIIGPAWTLQVEMLAAPFIFLGGWSLARYGYVGPLAFLGLSLVIYELPGLVGHISFLAENLFYMAIGALIPTEIGAGSGRVAERVGPLLIILGFVFVRMFLPGDSVAILLQAAFGYLLICLIVHGHTVKVDAFLNRPISQFLGRVSFGFYLWNVLFLNILWAFRYIYFPPFIRDYALEFGLIAAAALVLPSLLLAALSEKYIEKPFIDMGRTISAWVFKRAERQPASQIRTAR